MKTLDHQHLSDRGRKENCDHEKATRGHNVQEFDEHCDRRGLDPKEVVEDALGETMQRRKQWWGEGRQGDELVKI